jgi:hypothetical protein
MDTMRERVAGVLEEWYGTDAHCEGTWLVHRRDCANAILAIVAEDREKLVALAGEVAKEYYDAADWVDAIGKLQKMARAALTSVGK